MIAITPTSSPHDFFQEWSSARDYLDGRSLYPNLPEASSRLLGIDLDDSPGVPEVNAHPPTSIVLAIPFAFLDYGPALLIWRYLSLILMVSCFLVILHEVWGKCFFESPPLPVCLILFLMSAPVIMTTFHGQLNAVLLALFVLAWRAEKRGQSLKAAVAIGIAAAIKLNPILLLGYFVPLGKWKSIGMGLASFSLANGLALLIFGSQAFQEYNQVLKQLAPHRSGWSNASFPGFSAKLFNPAEGRPLIPLLKSPLLDGIFVAVCVLAVGYWTFRAVRKARPDVMGKGFGVAILALLLAGPITWEHTLLTAVVPLAILIKESNDWNRHRQALLYLATFGIWLIPNLVTYYLQIDDRLPATPMMTLAVHSYQFYSLLILFGLAVWPGRSRNLSPPSHQTVHPHSALTRPA